jgi:hypothetical protein
LKVFILVKSFSFFQGESAECSAKETPADLTGFAAARKLFDFEATPTSFPIKKET